MQRWLRAQRIFRFGALVALMIAMTAMMLPTGFTRAADDTMAAVTAAQAQLPSGYQVTYSQIVDLGGDGQMQAIIKAESVSSVAATLNAQVVGVLVRKGDAWQLVSQTQPFPAHLCGANCNAGTYALMRYDNGTLMPALSGVNDRGNLSADPSTAIVTLTGPVYAYADARCCAQYRYTRTFTWQGNALTQSDLTFAPAPEKTVPVWFTSEGPVLVTLLDGFVAQPALGDTITPAYIAPVFADTVTVRDAADSACTASGSAIAGALVQGITAGSGALWPSADGYNLALHWDSRAMPNGVMADSCTLDAGNNGGYVLHLTRVGNRFVGDTLYATPQIRDATPADAIQLPPV